MLTSKKKLEEQKVAHEKAMTELKDSQAAALEKLQKEQSQALEYLSDSKDDDQKTALEEQFKQSQATVEALMGQVKSMAGKLNVLDSVPELIEKHIKDSGIDGVDIEKIKEQLLKDSEQKTEEQQIQEDAVNKQFDDEFDKALEEQTSAN